MKILHICADEIGGAGRACIRLHEALNTHKDITSFVLLQYKRSNKKGLLRVAKSNIEKIIEKLRPSIDALPLKFFRKRKNNLFSMNILTSRSVLRIINEINPDIINLHWVNSGMLNLNILKHVRAKIFWSMHDLWPITGGCHYVYNGCDRFINGCSKCPLLNSNFPKFLLTKKIKIYKEANITFIALSKWIQNEFQKSKILKTLKVINLPNPINHNVFKPVPKKIAREILNINLDSQVIAFGAMDSTTTRYKGYNELLFALQNIKNKVELIIVGSNQGNELHISNVKSVTYIGTLHDDIALNLFYNSADIVVLPSLIENLSNMIMESLTVGIPVVAFNIGGNSDMIKHKQNGYLVDIDYEKIKKLFSTASSIEGKKSELAKGIDWILDNRNLIQNQEKIRNETIKQFNYETISTKYIKIYKDHLK